jgi:hypothetical protein
VQRGNECENLKNKFGAMESQRSSELLDYQNEFENYKKDLKD